MHFPGILAQFWFSAGYFGANFGVTPSHFLGFLRQLLLLWHVSMYFGPFQMLLGRLWCRNSPKQRQNGLKACVLAPQVVLGQTFSAHILLLWPQNGPKRFRYMQAVETV